MEKEPFDLEYWSSMTTDEVEPPAYAPAEATWEAEEPEGAEPPMPAFPIAPGSWQNGECLKTEDFPLLLQKVMAVAGSEEERDMLLLGSITALSACLDRVYGVYGNRKVYPNLFLFVLARASSGKGRLMLCKHLVMKIHLALRQEAKDLRAIYQEDLAEFNARKVKDPGGRPPMPPERMLFIPANNSSTGFFQLLADNDGRGLMLETEGDTLSQTFRTDYGNYSDGFRKAFHHETISYFRRTDREYVDIQAPRLSAVLSGTPSQVVSLIPTSENGLFSRFMFYCLNSDPVWKDVFDAGDGRGQDEYFETLGEEFFRLYERLQASPEICFRMSLEQKFRFNNFFYDVTSKYLYLQGPDYVATIRRLGLIFFRICMVLSALRLADTDPLPEKMECDARDFQIASAMVGVLVRHSSRVFSELPEEVRLPQRKNLKQEFLDALPAEFNRKTFQEVGHNLGLSVMTADRYIRAFTDKGLVHRPQRDSYKKVSPAEEGG
jgi:hypothetical protein